MSKKLSKEKIIILVELIVIFIAFLVVVLGWPGFSKDIVYPHTNIVKVIEIVLKVIFVISPIITMIVVFFTKNEKKLIKRTIITMLITSVLVPILLLLINIGIIKYDQSHYDPTILITEKDD